MNLRISSFVKFIIQHIQKAPEWYKEEYLRVLFGLFVLLIALWGWWFYQYALRPATLSLETTVPSVSLPEELLSQAVSDIKARKEQFLTPVFDPVRDPFMVPAPSPETGEGL